LLGRNLKQKERRRIVRNGVEVGEVEKGDSLNINPLPKPGDIKVGLLQQINPLLIWVICALMDLRVNMPLPIHTIKDLPINATKDHPQHVIKDRLLLTTKDLPGTKDPLLGNKDPLLDIKGHLQDIMDHLQDIMEHHKNEGFLQRRLIRPLMMWKLSVL